MAGPSPSSTEYIRKMGQLVKIKTNKKKYFVLRDETKSSSARLEYYDSEKKWRTGVLPKRTIVLKNCFNINAKPDAKHKHAIALYTKDDCFAISCQSEEEQQDWLTNMIELRNRNLDENTALRPLFEHIWPVTVKSRGLGGNERKVMPGQYRLCLTNKDLSLIRMNNDQNNDIVLPLDCIRRCGHTHQFFFLELGRSAITGSGSLWLQVEDMVISQNIHEALLSSMKNNEVPALGVFRGRSGSSATESRPRSSVMPSGSSTSHAPKRTVSIYTSNPSPDSQQNEASPRTTSVIEIRHPGSKSSLSEPPLQNSSVGPTSRPDSKIAEESVKSHYMTINPVAEAQSIGQTDAASKRKSEIAGGVDVQRFPNVTLGDASKSVVPTSSSSSWSESSSHDASNYVPMENPPVGESYMMMSAPRFDEGLGGGLEPHGSSSSVSSVISSVGSISAERSFHSLSHLQEVTPDGGYIEMNPPLNLPERASISIRPDVVPCYVRDESAEEFPKRAYSVGSKPVPIANKPLNNSYIDMSGKAKAKKEAEKSSSAPHLNDDDEKKKELSDLFMELDFNRSKRDVKAGSEFRPRTSSGSSRDRMKPASLSTKDAIQRFSLFSRNKSSAGQHSDARRPRTSTICQESLRPRTSSFGPSDQRPRSSSGGNACFADVLSRQLQVGSEQSSQDSLRRHSKRSSQESVESGKSDAYINMSLGKRSTDRLAKMAEGDAGYMDMKPGEESRESNYMRMTSSGTSAANPAVTTASENTSARTSFGVVMRQKLETVKAGSGEDYLDMTPGSAPPQPKAVGASPSVQPKVKMTKSLGETSSSYMEMAPRGVSGEKAPVLNSVNSVKKDGQSSQKNDNYMEMSLGSGKRSNSLVTRSANEYTLAQAMNEHAKGSSSAVPASPGKDAKGSGREHNASPKEDIPPPPFELSIPLQSFLLYTDHTNVRSPTIPAQLPASRAEPLVPENPAPHGAVTGGSVESLETPVQISYATLDLGSSVDHHPNASASESRGTGVVGRGRGYGQSSHRHVYAQIDFEKLEDRPK